jgi:hypothetical protein
MFSNKLPSGPPNFSGGLFLWAFFFDRVFVTLFRALRRAY